MRRVVLTVAGILMAVGFTCAVVAQVTIDHDLHFPIHGFGIFCSVEVGGGLVVITINDVPHVFSLGAVAAVSVLVAFALLLFLVPERLRSQRRARLAAQGRCTSCAYDLTGNTSGICPECGATVKATS